MPDFVIGIIIAVVVLIVIIVLWYILTMNSLRKASLKVDEANAGIDVALTKRYDVLTKQLDVVKGYASYESKTLYESIRLRKGMSFNEKKEMASKMDEVANQFRIVAEAYPDLKAGQNYLALQDSITDVEEHLQAARRLYNANVTAYNTKIAMFPSSIVAGMCAMTKKELFEAESYKRQDVKMEF